MAGFRELARNLAGLLNEARSDREASARVDRGQWFQLTVQFRDRTREIVTPAGERFQAGGRHSREIDRQDQQQGRPGFEQSTFDATQGAETRLPIVEYGPT